MSGGAFDYLGSRIEDVVPRMGDYELRELTYDFAQLVRNREWYLSGDTGEDDWNASREAFKKKWLRSNEQIRLENIVTKACEQLKSELLDAIK